VSCAMCVLLDGLRCTAAAERIVKDRIGLA